MLGVQCVWDSSWRPEMGRVVEKASADTSAERATGKMWAWSHKVEDSIFALILIFQACFMVPQVPGCSSLPLREQDTSLCVVDVEQVRGRLVLWGICAWGSGNRWGPCRPGSVVAHRMFWVWRDLKGHLVPGPLPWAGMYCEDGLQKAVDLLAGWLQITRRKKMSHQASRRRMWGNYRLVSVSLQVFY